MTIKTETLPAGFEIRYMRLVRADAGWWEWIDCDKVDEGATIALVHNGKRVRSHPGGAEPLIKIAKRMAHDAELEKRWIDAAVRACQGRYVAGELGGFGLGSVVDVHAFGRMRPGVVTELTKTRMRVMVTTPAAINSGAKVPNYAHGWYKLPAGEA